MENKFICDNCGITVTYDDFCYGDATRMLLTPSSDLSVEEYETLCGKCVKKELEDD